MPDEARRSIDTDPHPTLTVYSAGNFAEVAPERLSIAAWSLIGDPVERGCRALVQRVWPAATWHRGSHYTFVGYFGCRPYHNLSAYCALAAQLPWLSGEDVTASYFEGVPPPRTPPGARASRPARGLALPRLARELGSLERRATLVDGEVQVLEERARAAGSGRDPARLVLEEALRALGSAWDLHYSTTLTLVPLRAAQQRVAERSMDHWHELEPLVNRPDELVWDSLYAAAELEGERGAGAFLRFPFYEIADAVEPWTRYGARARPAQPAGRAVDPARAEVGAIAHRMLGRGGAGAVWRLTNLMRATLAGRERSKSLAMRVLHVFRELLPHLAGEELADAWPYLRVAELLEERDRAGLLDLAARRREECTAALEVAMPELIDTAKQGVPAPPRPPAARGVSAGYVAGVVVDTNGAGNSHGGPKILVCESADADIEPVLPSVDGIVTARGSLLSHISIIAREYGIPAVVGHPLALDLKPGQRVSLDGTNGEVRILDA